MIDYIKLSLSSYAFAGSLRDSRHLKDKWSTLTKLSTGNTINYSSYQGLAFKVFQSGRVEIEGSLHKYFNKGEHNHNDFSGDSLVYVISDLHRKFGDGILLARLENLEYGLNIKTPFCPTNFTKNIIIYLRQGARLKHAITRDDRKGFDKGVKFILDQYQIKIYNKGKQYNQDQNILRCEFKTIKMEIIKDLCICRLVDLTDRSKLERLNGRLLDCMGGILIKEQIDQRELSRNELRIFLECINPEFWVAIGKDKRAERKKQFARILREKATSDLKVIAIHLLIEKYKKLAAVSAKTANLLTGLKNHNPQPSDRLYNGLEGRGFIEAVA